MSKPAFFLEQIDSFLSGASNAGIPQNAVFCMMPFIHFHVTQYGTVTPCCVAPWDQDTAFGNVNEQNIEAIWNGKEIKNFRLKMLKGEADLRCARCYTAEKAGTFSLRSSINNLYARHSGRIQKTLPDGSLPQYKPVYLDIRFSNKCNFKCRICGPRSSSAWYEEGVQLGLPVKKGNPVTQSVHDLKNFLKKINPWISELEEIYFAGGEPLFLDEHYELLDALKEAGKTDLLLRYSTNFSSLEYEKGKAIDYWKSFEKVIVNASLDDMNARAELHRKGQNWKKTEQNIRRLKSEAPHVYFMVSPTISIWNIWNICAFHRYLVDQQFIEVDDLIPNMLEQPEYYSIKVLPPEIKKSLAEKLTAHAAWVRAQPTGYFKTKEWVAREFENIAGALNAEDRSALLPELLNNIKKLDEIRNENTFEVIPELKEAFAEIPAA